MSFWMPCQYISFRYSKRNTINVTINLKASAEEQNYDAKGNTCMDYGDKMFVTKLGQIRAEPSLTLVVLECKNPLET